MKLESTTHYRSLDASTPLSPIYDKLVDGEILEGSLVAAGGSQYPIHDGIPLLLSQETLASIERRTSEDYDRIADAIYDAAMDWQFAAFLEDEGEVRERMIDMLSLEPGMRVLEIGCGTGRDSFRLARRLSGGELHMQDISFGMVRACAKRMASREDCAPSTCKFDFSVSSATALPFPDNYFDAIFHFGGFNQFGDRRRGAAEMARVTKLGGRVLFGDEGVAPWLKNTEFDGIVTTNNPLFRANIPLHVLPVSARHVEVQWVIANCFYVIKFEKGEGPPPLDLDIQHKGWRGGSLRSRYYGVLEGVSPETKELVREAAGKEGKSVHEWLDRLIKDAAQKTIRNDNP